MITPFPLPPPPTIDAGPDLLWVHHMSRMLPPTLHQCPEGEAHHRHGVPCLWPPWPHWWRSVTQLLLHPWHPGTAARALWCKWSRLWIGFTYPSITTSASCSQLRESLDPDAYALFHKKLTEAVLMRDPKFLWCAQVNLTNRVNWRSKGRGCYRVRSWMAPMLLYSQCSFGFIYEREQLEATCPQCHQTFCVRCKRQVSHTHAFRSVD